MSAKIRVKAAYMDKGSSRFFDNLTPVSTWVEPGLTVAELLPTLTKRFWSVVASEVLDDDEGKNAKPEMVKAVSINFEGSLVLREDILYDVLVDGSPRSENASTPTQKDLSIIVGVKGASDYLPETSKSLPGKSPQPQQHWKITGQRPQGLPQSQPLMALPGGVTDIQFQNVQFPVLQHSTTPATSKPMMNVVPGGGGTQDATSITTLDSSAWAGLSNYPNIQLLHSNDGTTMHAVPSILGADGILGKRTVGDRDGEDRDCPLPFLRDISSVLELYERWELGLEGQKPLKKLAPAQYRCYRTRFHEIKNFVFHMQERVRNGEGGGDIREVAKKMQLELEDMKTSHGTRMGLPTYVRQTASLHVQNHRTGGSQTINNGVGAQKDGNAVTVHDAAADLLEKPKEEQEQG